jgi:hypothetical protein
MATENENKPAADAPKVESPRETLNRAFDQAEAVPEQGAAKTGQAAADSAKPATAAAAKPGEEAGKAAEAKPGESVRTAGAPQRDPSTGKFKKAGEAAAGEAAAEEKPDAAAAAAAAAKPGEEGKPAADDDKWIPRSWKPHEREAWAKGDVAGIKKAAKRRDYEITATLKETEAARQGWDTIRQIVSPFEQMIRAEGSEPFRAIHSLLTTSAKLRTSPPGTRAEMIAAMTKQFLGVDDQNLLLLDDALRALRDGKPAGVAPGQQEFRDPRFDQFMEELRTSRQTRQQTEVQKATEEWENFVESHEFALDLKDEIADLIETRAKRGVALTYEEAYNLALRMDPALHEASEQKKAAEAANRGNPAIAAAKAAGSSVRAGPPAPPAGEAQPKDLRGTIEKAWEQSEARGS